jgi:hypothetical protein
VIDIAMVVVHRGNWQMLKFGFWVLRWYGDGVVTMGILLVIELEGFCSITMVYGL